MRRIAYVVTILLTAVVINAGLSDEEIYCPLLQNTRWTYTVHNKNNEKPDYERSVEINGSEIYEGLSYFSFYSPDADAKYLLRKDGNGVYIKSARYAVPFLSFIHFDVIFNPPVYAIKFPLHRNDTWNYDGVASLNALFLTFPTKISAQCTHQGIEVIEALGRTMTAYKLYGELKREDVEKPFKATWWFGRDVGLARYESEKIVLTLKHFEILPNPVTKTTNAGETK